MVSLGAKFRSLGAGNPRPETKGRRFKCLNTPLNLEGDFHIMEANNSPSLFDRTKGLADCPSILDQLGREIEERGFAGSTDLPKLVYLVFLTGMLKRPVSLVIKGPSGAGKSFSLNAAMQFIPESAYERFEGMSEKALVYLKGLNVKHRHLVIGEAAGLASGEGRTLLRQLLSEGRVRYATVQSTSNGLVGSELPTLEGPTGLIMTTTATGLHLEDESRMLSVNIVESPEQIAAALMAQALGTGKAAKPIDTDAWHALYELTRTNVPEVAIPFAPKIVTKLPKSHDRIRRDFPQFLSLIAAHALLHRVNRERMKEQVLANVDDYVMVRNLINESLSQSLAVTVSESVRMVVEGVIDLVQLDAPFSEGVSQIKLAEHLKRDPSVISRNVSKAIDNGYLENVSPGQGREARLVIGEVELPRGSVLPHPDELFG